jgi:3-hydroxyanthranilate 3,4-dioxygenase
MAISKPFNLSNWIEQNRHLLVPPVGNKNIYVDSGDYIVMIVAGPNARKDYHYNETEELFYQLEGDITVFIQEEGQKKAIHLTAGDMFLLPAKTPHSPSRTKNSIGLVIEILNNTKLTLNCTILKKISFLILINFMPLKKCELASNAVPLWKSINNSK